MASSTWSGSVRRNGRQAGRSKALLGVGVVAALTIAGFGLRASSLTIMRVPVPKPAPTEATVAIAKGTDYKDTTLKAVGLAGGLEGIVKKGATILIKPNVVGPSPSGAGRITDWRIVQTVVDKCLELGAAKVIVGEGPVDQAAQVCFETAGYYNIKGAEIMDLSVPKDQCYYAVSDRSLIAKPLYIPKIFFDADAVIDISIMKTHDTEGVTMSLKNIGIGIPSLKAMDDAPGWKQPLHYLGVNRTITSVNLMRKADFFIVDAMVAGEGNGPVNPTAKPLGLVLAGRDPVAVDTIGTCIMGFDPDTITHIVYGAAMGLGVTDLSKIRVVGEDYKALVSPFKKPDVAATTSWLYRRTAALKQAAPGLKVDGDLSDWKGAWTLDLTRQKQVNVGAADWSGPADASGTLMIAKDAKYLYLGGTVTDDDFIPTSSDPAKATAAASITAPVADGLEMLFSFDNPFEEADDHRDTYLAGKDFMLVAGAPKPGTIGKAAFVPAPGSKGTTPMAVNGSTVATAAVPGGYSIEVAIPLAALGRKNLDFSSEFWFDTAIADVDASGFSKVVWSGSTRGYKNPMWMGRVLAAE